MTETKIYVVFKEEETEAFDECFAFLRYTLDHMQNLDILRESEVFHNDQSYNIIAGTGLTPAAKKKLIEESAAIVCLGSWREDHRCIIEASFGNKLGLPVYDMRREPSIALETLNCYLEEVRPIEAAEWDTEKAGDLLVYEHDEQLTVIDGHHRYNLANRLGTVKHLSGWIVKKAFL